MSVHLESASPLIDVPIVRDPEIRRVDGSVHHAVKCHNRNLELDVSRTVGVTSTITLERLDER